MLGDRATNRIIDATYSRQVWFEQRHPPQFYPTATNPCIITPPNLNNLQALVLLNMLQSAQILATPSSMPVPSVNLDTCTPPLSLLHPHNYSNQPFTHPPLSSNALVDCSCDSLDGSCHSWHPLPTPFNKILEEHKWIIISAISQIFKINTSRDW